MFASSYQGQMLSHFLIYICEWKRTCFSLQSQNKNLRLNFILCVHLEPITLTRASVSKDYFRSGREWGIIPLKPLANAQRERHIVHAGGGNTCMRFSGVRLFASLQTALATGSSRQEYWRGLSMPFSREFSWPRDGTCISYISCIGRWVLCD